MSLHLIHGPPNTGRTGVVLGKYTELLHRDPVLVVPGVDDVLTWERRITRDGDAFTGARIQTFNEICGEILRLEGSPRPSRASELRRQHLVRQAIVKSGWTEVIGRLPFQPGLVEAVLELIDDFRRELIDPDSLDDTISERGLADLKTVASVYRTYLELLTGSGWTDLPREIEAAVKSKNLRKNWENRPIFVTGFDDLSGQQLELINRLAVDVGTEVWITLTYEPENPAMELTNRMMAELRNIGQATEFTETPTSRSRTSDEHDQALLEVERRFMRGFAESEAPIPATEAVAVLRSSGPRNEGESIASEVARLLDLGTQPEAIAIAIESPAAQGRMLRDILTRFDVPSSLEADIPARDTMTGQTVLAVLEAVRPGGTASAAFAWLRSPLFDDQEVVDNVELECLQRSEDSAAGVMRRLADSGGRTPEGWDDLTRAVEASEPVNAVIAGLALKLGELALFASGAPDPAAVLESQTGAAISDACDEVSLLQDKGNTGIVGIHDAIESGAVKVWSMPAAGTVRIASPYSLRAKRFEHLFFASLQESGVHDQERAGPFLSTRDRSNLGMSQRSDPENQERYLFYSCLTVPTEGLWLSCRTSDETGKAEHESPLISAVEGLFEKIGKVPAVRHGGRAGGTIVFGADVAPNQRELSRILAASGATPDQVKIAPGVAKEIGVELDRAQSVRDAAARLDSIEVPGIIDRLSADPTFSATEIEAYAGCPYRWFIEKQLNPVEFGPDSDPMTMGSLLHVILETLYRENEGQMPRPETVDAWLGRVPTIVAELAAGPQFRMDGDDPARSATRNRAIELVNAHLRREATFENPLHMPKHIEYGFGTRNSEAGAVVMGTWWLKGKIDRVDVAPNKGPDGKAEAVIVDYKSGNVDSLTYKKSKRDRKLQLPLYLRAAGISLDVKPVAALYVPIKSGKNSSRGAFEKSSLDQMLDRGVAKSDLVENIEVFIEEGVKFAGDSVAGIMAGILRHDPKTCPNHFDHPAVPDRVYEDEEIFPGAGKR
jgi:ATP-dependent helicase/DNAse subunit B